MFVMHACMHASTHPLSEEGQSGDDPLFGDALEDPGCSVQAAHAGSQGGDVEAQQKEEAHQGDLEEEGKQTGGWKRMGWGRELTTATPEFSSAAASPL